MLKKTGKNNLKIQIFLKNIHKRPYAIYMFCNFDPNPLTARASNLHLKRDQSNLALTSHSFQNVVYMRCVLYRNMWLQGNNKFNQNFIFN